MASKKIANVNKDQCVSCGACTKVCPKGALSIEKGCYSKVDKNLCVGCGICTKTCPADCIVLVQRGEENEI